MRGRWRYTISGMLLAGLVSACSGPTGTGAPAASPSAQAGMAHGSMTATSAAPFDARFIDAMIMHHQGAIDMARQAQQQAEHAEIKRLAEQIIATQQAEIEQMQQWRQEWYGQTR